MQVKLWKSLRSVPKIYGMAILGVVCGLIGCFIVMIFLGFMWSVSGAIPGYFIGDYLSKVLHDGKAQRMIRWYFPSFRKSVLPDSTQKYFFKMLLWMRQ